MTAAPPPVIGVLGDTHGSLPAVRWAVETLRPMGVWVMVQVGDWGFLWRGRDQLAELEAILAANQIELWFLAGNHDDYEELARRGCTPDDTEATYLSPHVRHLPRGYRFTMGTTRFMAFGGAVSVDRADAVEGVGWFRQEAITDAQVFRAAEGEPVDVLLTHDAPAGIARLDQHLARFAGGRPIWPERELRAAAHNRLALRVLADHLHPRLVVHGHYHYRYTDQLPGCHIEGLDRDGTGPLSVLTIRLVEP